MNPDLFTDVAVPDSLQPYIRRILAGCAHEPIYVELAPAASGYCYLGWLARGRWSGKVNGDVVFDSDQHGRLHLSGQIDNADIWASLSGPFVHIIAEFRALGQYQFLGIPGIDTLELALPPNAFDSPNLWSIQQALQEVPDNADVTELIDLFINALVKAPTTITPVPNYLTHAIDLIESKNGFCRIGRIAEEAGVSERQLRREFIKSVGLKPKVFCNVLQVNTAYSSLLTMPDAELSALSASCGFSDQAHLTHAFQKFLGESPMAIADSAEATFARFVGHCRSENLGY